MPAEINIPKHARYVIDVLNAAGYAAYIVGGCVRDSLLGLSPKDWDVAAAAAPDVVKRLFKRTVDTGLRHGTVTVLTNGGRVEVTTFRSDGKYSDGRRPDSVAFTDRLDEDLLRRDFTINAIAYHPRTGYADPFDGMADIERRLIRGVGEPAARFREDALRMMRAVRFSATLNFEIEKATLDAVVENAPLISRVSVERVRDEILKTLMSGNAGQVKLFSEYGLLGHIDARADKYIRENLDAVFLAKEAPGTATLRLSLLFMNMDGDSLKQTLKFFRADNNTIKEVTLLVPWIHKKLVGDTYAVRTYLNEIGSDFLEQVLILRNIVQKMDKILEDVNNRMDEILRRGDCFSLNRLAINGDDLKKLGFSDGREIGARLRALLDAVMQEPALNNYDALSALALRDKGQ
jgi:tRNA nucleotidyltransferase (CCA-adding enzyme)